MPRDVQKRTQKGSLKKQQQNTTRSVKNFEEIHIFCSKFIEGKMATGILSQTITRKLTDAFKPYFLNVINESYMHNVPKDSETHFKVVIVSDEFTEKALLQRHRLVNAILKEELAGGVHALSIQAKTPQQWEDSGERVPASPACMGGSKR